jgi:dTDP-4-amino-4,6-dideoxygalactose transaminase
MFSAYKSLGFKIKDYPVSFDNYSREITLPVYEDLSDEQVEEVINATINSVNEILND